MKQRRSIGTGRPVLSSLKRAGSDVVVEDGVRIFHPENVEIGDNVYIGHDVIIHGYHNGRVAIGDGSWIGPRSYLHGAGGIEIGKEVGIGPYVKVLTSEHGASGVGEPIIRGPLVFGRVLIEDGCDIGIGAIILPGVKIGKLSQIGAGAVVTKDVPELSVASGVPARVVRKRS
jgi:acetyltransferase-like isoleucine patch superfamily enzyme